MTLKLEDLSRRRREIAEMVGDGLTYPEIALRLPNLRSFRGGSIRPRTVQMHVVAIAEQLGSDDVPPKVRVMLWVRHERASAA